MVQRADEALFECSIDEIDRYPVGVITLDRAGVILHYNRAESVLSGLAPQEVIGRRFFGDVAPCAAVREFEGRFLAFAAETTTAIERFDFAFAFAWGTQDVEITLMRRERRPEINVVVRTRVTPGDGQRATKAGAPATDTGAVPFWSEDSESGAIAWSPEMLALLAAPQGFMPHAGSLVSRVHLADRRRVAAALAQSERERGRPTAMRCRLLGFDGAVHDVVIQCGSVGDDARRFRGGTVLSVETSEYAERTESAASVLLREALAEDRVEVLFQPIVDAATSAIEACEALVRIRLPDGSLVLPKEFIPDAEATGTIVALGERVVEIVAATMRGWNGTPLERLRVSVNVAPRQFADEAFLPFLRRTIVEAGIAPDRIELELTEGLLERFDETLAALMSMKLLGMRLAIDDFGTGYSALAYLKYFPIDTLKLDRSFVTGIGRHPLDAAIASTIVALARELSLDIVAEGVEVPMQREYLADLGVTKMQGFLFGRPMTAAALVEAVHAERAASVRTA